MVEFVVAEQVRLLDRPEHVGGDPRDHLVVLLAEDFSGRRPIYDDALATNL